MPRGIIFPERDKNGGKKKTIIGYLIHMLRSPNST